MLETAQTSWALWVPIAAFTVCAFMEWMAPRYALQHRNRRWITHAGFFIVSIGLGRAIALISVSSAAAFATQKGWGALHVFDTPNWAQLLAVLIVYDFAVWAQHFAMHRFPILWRIHRVHHSDHELDVTSALRFHPFEIIVSTLYKSLVIMMLGAPVWIAVIVELWLNINALFNHSNIALPRRIDHLLRYFIVTPDMHLVHHSTSPHHQHHNFGFGLTIWDRLFNRYLVIPEMGSKMGRAQQSVGLLSVQNSSSISWRWNMLLPFRPVE